MNSIAQITGPIRRYRLTDYSSSPRIVKERWMSETEQVQAQRQLSSTYQVWEVDPETPAYWSMEGLINGIFGFWQGTSIVEFEEVRGGDPTHPDEAAYLEFVRLAEILGACSVTQLDGILEAYWYLVCQQEKSSFQPVGVTLQPEQTTASVPKHSGQNAALVPKGEH